VGTHTPFTVSADVYDIIYQHLPYDEQAARIVTRVRALLPTARSLLEVGCGTGQFLARFHAEFSVEGLDISEQMLAVAATRVPDLPLHCTDMRSFQLGRQFDVVACLFSSIGYMTSPSDLRAAVSTMAGHLVAGGVMIIDPWFTPKAAVDGFVGGSVDERGDVVVARVIHSLVEGRVSVTDMHHVVARANVGIEHYIERHRMGLFSDEEYAALLDELGCDAARFDDVAWSGRSRWVAVKR
jgi:SAM-dependent methyltransferase